MGEVAKTDEAVSPYCRQMADKHFFLADEMVLKYGFDPTELHGWTRLADEAGWRSPFPNPWSVIHLAEDRPFSVRASSKSYS